MTCADVEILICDYLDGSLPSSERAELDRHLSACTGCAELARDAGIAAKFMERVADVEPPPALINRILFETRFVKHRLPLGAMQSWLGRLLEPVLQPRFVMGMALTIFSLFTMLHRMSGLPVRQITPADLDPVKVWTALDNRVHRTWERTVKFYDSIRLVYEIQLRLRDWKEQQAELEPAEPEQSPAAGDTQRLTPRQKDETGPPGKTKEKTEDIR